MKKYLLALLLGLSASAWASNSYQFATGSNLQSQQFFTNNGGFINHISPLLIPGGYASDIQDITMDDRGQLTRRSGYVVLQSTSALLDGSTTTIVTGGTYHLSTVGNPFFTVVVGSDIYRTANSLNSYSKITGSVIVTPNATNLAQATHVNDNAVFCNELDMPFYVTSSGNAQVISTNTFTQAKTCATYGVYLVVANTFEGITSYPSRVRWSDIQNTNSFPVLNYIDVEPNDGDKIVGIVTFDESVYIFKQHSIYQMLITGLDGPDAFVINPIARNVGAWAKDSIKPIPNVGIAFLAQNTAYLLTSSGVTPIGDPIQRTFDGIQRSQWTQAVAEVYPKKYQYWLAVSTAGTSNTEVLVYDYIQNNWTKYNMSMSMLSQATDNLGNNVLLSGDYHATTYEQDDGNVDNPRGVSKAISATYTTGDMYLNSVDVTKGFKYLYLYMVGDQNYTLTVNGAWDFSTVYDYTQSVTLGSAGALYDTGIYDTDIYPPSGSSVARFELNKDARALKLQFVNNNTNQTFGLIGWTIVYSLEDFRE